ncbi:MAG TPA: methyl-accepting chemotaxis protein [Bacillota bacterium]|nr:methyl-accepting chemotaxis protein [Bacillota bacterium]HQI16193.1 methyl-accepting chemotaxis protein [Bacillota bacterium]HQJ37646.1 methyl-accepting chemotaxis protein [Bacillota bacterium]
MKSLKIKLLIPVLLVSSLALLLTTYSFYITNRTALEKNIEVQNGLTAQEKSQKINGLLSNFAKILETLSESNLISGIDEQKEQEVLAGLIKKHEHIQDIYVGLAANGKFIDGTYWVPDAGWDPRTRGWYKKAMETGGVIFTDPYIDSITGNIVVTPATVVYSPDGSKRGVMGADISLEEISRIVNEIKVGENGYALLIDATSMVMAHPIKELVGTKLLENEDKAFSELSETMLSSESGFTKFVENGEAKVVSFTTIPLSGWKLGIVQPEEEVYAEINNTANKLIMAVVAVLLIMSIVVFLISASITKPIEMLNRAAAQVAAGDLTNRVKISSKDEVGQLADSFNTMTDNIKALVEEINNLSHTVSSYADQMTTSSHQAVTISEQMADAVSDLAKGADTQAQSVQEGLNKIMQLGENLKVIVENTNNASEASDQVHELIGEGMKAVSLQNKKVAENTNAGHNVASAIKSLDEKSKQIGEIVEVISSISNQTNLLALNAAIEAARAGEQGRGFAVVSDEVRKLAEQSSAATGKISNLIEEIKQGTENAVKEVETSELIIKEQETSVADVKRIFEIIASSVEQMRVKFVEVTKGTKNIDTETAEINEVISKLAVIAEGYAANSEEVAASTEEQVATLQEISANTNNLAEMAAKLKASLEKFKI